MCGFGALSIRQLTFRIEDEEIIELNLEDYH
jgi:hypothetical protein